MKIMTGIVHIRIGCTAFIGTRSGLGEAEILRRSGRQLYASQTLLVSFPAWRRWQPMLVQNCLSKQNGACCYSITFYSLREKRTLHASVLLRLFTMDRFERNLLNRETNVWEPEKVDGAAVLFSKAVDGVATMGKRCHCGHHVLSSWSRKICSTLRTFLSN